VTVRPRSTILRPGGEGMRQVRWSVLAAVALAIVIPALAGAAGRRPAPILYIHDLGSYQLYVSNGNGGFDELPFDEAPRRHPVLSPDGVRVVYAREDGGNWDLYVASTSGGEPIRLTDDAGFDGNPTWSPDGMTIAFEHDASGGPQIETIPATGGTPILLADGARPAWSPDGRRIAYEVWDRGTWHLALMQADGTGQSRLDLGSRFTGGPSWSPDGLTIAYEQQNADSTTSIWLMGSDGTGAHPLTKGPYDTEPAFNPGGGSVTFVRQGGLWSIGTDGVGVGSVTGTAYDFATDPSWSRSGSLAFASARGSASEIYSIKSDGSGGQRLTHFRALAGSPVWTPDRRTILFARLVDGRDRIYSMRADGGDVLALPMVGRSFLPVSISPDGTEMLVLGDGPAGSGLYVLRRDGLRGKRIVPKLDVYAGDFSPDGTQVVLEAPDGLYVAGVDGRDIRRLPWSRPDDAGPVWSRVGNRIAFMRSHAGLRQIYVATVGARSATQLTNFTGRSSYTPTWSPSGNEIAFDHEVDGQSQIFVMRADGTSPLELTTDADGASYGPVWNQ
jgi:Tol biopolymer transport system component